MGGDSNTAIGTDALEGNTSGDGNTAIGTVALLFNSGGSDNTAIGNFALFSNTGSGNTAVGFDAGSNLTAGDDNIYIGNDVSGNSESFTIRIGDNLPAGPGDSCCFIGGIDNQFSVNGSRKEIGVRHQILTDELHFWSESGSSDRFAWAR
jgi:hypothetical protein